MFDQEFGHWCRGSRTHISGHSDFGCLSNLGASSIFTWVHADTASAACPSPWSRFAITSITFAAVFGTQTSPVQQKNAWAPESSVTMSPRSATLLLYFWYWGSDSEFLRWQRSINDAKRTTPPSLLASPITSFLCLTFVSCHAGISLTFFPTLSPLPPLHLEFFEMFEASEWICAQDCSELQNLSLLR